jgi:transposase
MISVEAWTTIGYLKAQGLGTRKIAKQVGVARNTVRQAVRSEGPPKYERPPRPNPKLEPVARAASMAGGVFGRAIAVLNFTNLMFSLLPF